jgi:signal transduction histidine kinase
MRTRSRQPGFFHARPVWLLLAALWFGVTSAALAQRLPEPPSPGPSSSSSSSSSHLLVTAMAPPLVQSGLAAKPSAGLHTLAEATSRQDLRWAVQSGVSQATGLLLLTLGLFSLALWVRSRKESAYLLFALLAVAWCLRNLHDFVEVPRSRWALDWLGWLTQASMSWVLLLTVMFALHLLPRRSLLFERSLVAVAGLSSLAAMPFWWSLFDTSMQLHLGNVAAAVVATLFIAGLAWREGGRELGVIALSLGLTAVLGLHDLALMNGWVWSGHPYLMLFACLALVVSFLYTVQRRYVAALEQVDHLNVALLQRLQDQSLALHQHFASVREVERQQSLLIERQRLMQDMHDGLGSSLLSAMVAVEQGSMEQNQVVEVLRECVDDLRLVIDSLEPVGHDLVSLLATMRYRLGKRLQVGGLTLEWDVQDLPPLAWLEPPDALHVLRLMQEALTNVLKHARANRVRMVTRHHGSYVEIRVEDDGDGFDVDNAQRGRGLKSQQRRAQRLGGSLSIDSSPGIGTRLSLRLPVLRHSIPEQPPL